MSAPDCAIGHTAGTRGLISYDRVSCSDRKLLSGSSDGMLKLEAFCRARQLEPNVSG
jgi:hypothetical protein